MLEISSIPVCYMVKNGELVDVMTGNQKADKIEAFIKKGLE